MKKATKLRLIGGAVLLLLFWVNGHYRIEGYSMLILIFAFVICYEKFVVGPAEKDRPPPR
jgi:hypothetical protein